MSAQAVILIPEHGAKVIQCGRRHGRSQQVEQAFLLVGQWRQRHWFGTEGGSLNRRKQIREKVQANVCACGSRLRGSAGSCSFRLALVSASGDAACFKSLSGRFELDEDGGTSVIAVPGGVSLSVAGACNRAKGG